MKNVETKPVNVHAGHRQRMRDKVEENGLCALPKHEALEYLLFHVIPNRDVNQLAHELIDRFGSVDALLSADEADIVAMKGTGPKSAAFLKVLGEITDYYRTAPDAENIVIRGSWQALCHVRPMFGNARGGELALVCLDGQLRLADCQIHAADALTPDVLRWAAQVLNTMEFSTVVAVWRQKSRADHVTQADIRGIERLLKICKAMGTKVMDFMLVREARMLSMVYEDGRFNANAGKNGDWKEISEENGDGFGVQLP